MKNRENRDITLHEKSMAIRAKSALAGKYSYKYLKHEVERTYDFSRLESLFTDSGAFGMEMLSIFYLREKNT